MALKNTSPSLETIHPNFGSSFNVMQFDVRNPNKKANWHYHREVEMIFVENGSGKIHIGNHLSYFNHGTLVLIGSNLPHLGFMERLTNNELEIVVQFRQEFLGREFFNIPEMQSIKSLLERAKGGILFGEKIRDEIAGAIKSLPSQDKLDKLLNCVKILDHLANTNDYEILNANGPVIIANNQDNDRLDVIYAFIRNNFQDEIKLEAVANLVNMTVPSFCRYFKKSVFKTFTEYVNEVRIVHATKLLSESNKSLTEICYDCGYNNQSHFIRQFKKITGLSPSEYRKQILKAFV